MEPQDHRPTLQDIARSIAPQLSVVSASQPEPVMRSINVVAISDSAECARRAVLALERLEYDDEKLGVVVMSRDETAMPPGGSEGIARQVFPRVVLGGIVGAFVGLVLAGGAALLFGVEGAGLVAAVLGGAVMGGAFGAIWTAFAGMGGSDAYRQTFVDDEASELTIVSLHTDDPTEADAARRALRSDGDLTVVDLDRDGHRVAHGG